jgi:deoxyribodipyrimidine photolyase-related protein
MSATGRRLHLILGDQLFAIERLKAEPFDLVYMAEDEELCTITRHHQLKIVFFLASMRSYRDELVRRGERVIYRQLEPDSKIEKAGYERRLSELIRTEKITDLVAWEIEDQFFADRIATLCRKLRINLHTRPSPMFLTTRGEFGNYLKAVKKPFMKTFYERQRKRLQVLVTKDGQPVGGQWSFDEENRKKYPKEISVPEIPRAQDRWSRNDDKNIKAVIKLVEARFSDHPGQARDFWLPVSHEGAVEWLDAFLGQRLAQFGPYEDAIHPEITYGFHSVLSPLLNNGLLTPDLVVERTLQTFKKERPPLASVEGFLRQIIGWREFIRGIYHFFGQRQATSNFWRHDRQLAACWWTASTGLPPVDDAIRKAQTLGWTHHIERLMVLSNAMLLCRVQPKEAHRWFMEFHLDSAEWVMGPNVFGMGQFSDGGVFATKPYICGSNYILKMSPYKKGPWCDELDALYWSFIDDHRDFYAKNPRMSVMVKSLDRMPEARLRSLKQLAKDTIRRLTVSEPHRSDTT